MGTEVEILAHRRGHPVYSRNPSIPTTGSISRRKRRQIGTEAKGFVVNAGSGEVMGPGVAVAYEVEEVDESRFVKLYLAGIKSAAGLSKAGLVVFELVYNLLRDKPNVDRVELSLLTSGLKKNTYYSGVKELLDKEFLYCSPFEGTFYINVQFMFNGDRLAFVKEYHRRGRRKHVEAENHVEADADSGKED